MLSRQEFKTEHAKVIEWITEYFEKIKSFPVKSQVLPGEIYNQIPGQIPEKGTNIDVLLQDLTEIILPGITHWQHPNFHAYFNANSSIESVFAEFITAAIGAQCMIWETSPAAAELEERMMEWMRDAMGLPAKWEGVIQDTASTATLTAMVCAREQVTNFESNEHGVPGNLRIYCSRQTHSSIEKGAVIAGIGRKNVVPVGAKDELTLSAKQLEIQIETDKASNLLPCCVIATLGTTGTVAIDDLKAISKVCQKHNIWLHVDAAYIGTALFLPEYRWIIDGIEDADSFVFNPHKWMFTNFDCTAYYVRDANHLIRTFEILPEYLKTKTRGSVNDYRDWGIPLGRRFRALKLWFVLRSYGLEGIQDKIRQHIELNRYFAHELMKIKGVYLFQDPILNFTCFQWNRQDDPDGKVLQNEMNALLVDRINKTGKAYLSYTKIANEVVIRVVIGQTYVTREDIDDLLQVIREEITLIS